MTFTRPPDQVSLVVEILRDMPTDLLESMLNQETNPALAWLIQVELSRRTK